VMFASHPHCCGVLEMSVMFFQTCGILCLLLYRLTSRGTAWSNWGRVGLIISLFGLGVSGALCGRQDSEFALFAGGTMTLLLIGVTIGGGSVDSIDASGTLPEPGAV